MPDFSTERDSRALEPLTATSGNVLPAVAKLPKKAVTLGMVTAGFLTLAAGTAVLFFFEPSKSDVYPPCLFRSCTGFYCPGCGTTRALHALVHGNFGEAFGLNPLIVLLLPFLGYYLISYAFFGARRGRPMFGSLASPFWGQLAFVTILAYWVLRNIPLYPFSLLAP